MKVITFVRHGKSSWNHGLKDSERPLKERAYKDAEKVLRAFKPTFDPETTLWTSYAVRAHKTAELFQKELEVGDEKFLIKEDLYTFNSEDLLTCIRTAEEETERLMIFGHNPAITELVNRLSNQVFDNIPTTGLVQIGFTADSWKELKRGRILLSLFPKNL